MQRKIFSPTYITKFHTIFLCAIVTLTTPMLSYAIEDQDLIADVLQANDTEQLPLSIKDKFNTLEKKLFNLQKILNNQLNKNKTQQFLQDLTAYQRMTEKEIEALRKDENHTVTQQQIDNIEAVNQDINKFKEEVIIRLEQLTDGEVSVNQAQETYRSLQQLLSNPVHQANIDTETKNKIHSSNALIEQLIQQFAIEIEEQSLQLRDLEASNKLLSRWQSLLSSFLITQQKNNKNLKQNTQLDDKFEELRGEIEALQIQLNNDHTHVDLDDIEKIQQSIYEKQTLLWLIKLDKKLIALIEHPTLNLSKKGLEALSLFDLKQQQKSILDKQTRLAQLKETLENRHVEFQRHVEVIGPQPILEEAFSQRMKAIAYQRLLLQNQPIILSSIINEKHRNALLSNDHLYNKKQITKALKKAPDSLIQMLYQVQISFKALAKQLLEKPIQALLLAGLITFLVTLGIRFIVYLTKQTTQLTHKNETGLVATLAKLTQVVRNHKIMFLLFLFISSVVRTSEVPYPSNHIIRTLLYVIIMTTVWLMMIHFENRSNLLRNKAFLQVLATLMLASFVTLYAVGYMASVAPSVLAFYEKGLMITIAIFIWVERKKIVFYFSKQNDEINSRGYNIYLSVINALPWFVIAICVVSLLGFSRLAWFVLGYLGVAILYCICLVLGIKAINLWRKKGKLYTLKHFKYGAFIATNMVSPLSTAAKVLWLWLMTTMLFEKLNWTRSSYLITEFFNIVQTPLLSIGKTGINLQTISLSILAIYIIFRMARWLKTFSYHWLFSRVQDLGIRGSLSIFTQYVAAIIGILIALNVLGIDLTSLTVFAGALGVGVGLGLQDIAKNFISGILLLIERPLRNGDWVSIDGNEGKVKSIGMRAIIMETFDRQEVIIPNGNAIGNSFINNTHSDSVLRTVLYVGADYDSDPSFVINVLESILKETESVLVDPEPNIVLWEYADSSINYRIQYYVNIDKFGLFTARTAVLNSIWHEFKANGIGIPFPQRDINLRSKLEELTLEKDN